MDAEFETAPSLNGRKAVRANDVPTSDVRSSVTPQKLTGSESDHSHQVPSHYKEPIPGTSTFSANPNATASSGWSKKRKATSQAMPTATFSQPGTRRSSTTGQMTPSFRDSNMLTFDSCGGRLKGKKLIADDGTALEVNGNVSLRLETCCNLRS